jgi:hypothetical protein
MAQTWRFYLVSDDGTVTGTSDFEIAAAAKRDGSTLVLEPRSAEYTFDGDTQMVEEADPDDHLVPDDEDDEDGDD